MAGHKGYGLGLWAEVLSAVLPGGAMTWQVGSWMFDPADQPSKHNAGFIALDVATIAAPAEFASRIRKLIDEIHAAPKADGVDRLLMPGEREWDNRRKAQTEGIPLPADVLEKLRLSAKLTGDSPAWLTP
jgi:LDH2 family malate/lactate/ureidoglycolate dehydrogenase